MMAQENHGPISLGGVAQKRQSFLMLIIGVEGAEGPASLPELHLLWERKTGGADRGKVAHLFANSPFCITALTNAATRPKCRSDHSDALDLGNLIVEQRDIRRMRSQECTKNISGFFKSSEIMLVVTK